MTTARPTEAEIKAKDKLIKAEKRKLTVLLRELDDNRRKAAEGLIDECAFMRATLKQLRELINAEGAMDIMQQGDYSIKREHPAMRSYSTMIQKYTAASKQLYDMLPEKPPLPEDDGFERFRNMRNAGDGDGGGQ